MTRIGQYHFYERDWDSYERLRDSFEWEVPEQFNMAEYVCDRWARERGRVAFFADDESGDSRTLTFRDVQLDANRLANHLSEAGVTAGDRIGICLGQRPEAAIAHIAAWKLGAVSVPLSTQFGDDALAYRLDDCRATACIVGESSVETLRSIRDDLEALETVLTVGTDPAPTETAWDAAMGQSSRRFETAETNADDDAIIIYTSGTTGDPKGVLHAHQLLFGNLPAFAEGFLEDGTTDGTVFWTPVEWSWIGSLFSLVMPALYYGRPVVAYDTDRFDAESAFELLERYEVTDLGAPPTALRMMMQIDDPAERYDLKSVRRVGAGGEAVGESVVDWVRETFDGVTVEELYGQTEANLLVADCRSLKRPRSGTIGLAVPGHEVAIVDPETAEPIDEPGEIGEIAVRYEDNPVCFEEYWEKPELTERKVQNGWLLTEDLGSVDEDGFFSFEGRKDDVIITSGYRVSPEELEETITGHDAVADVAVIGVPDEERGTVPKAFVVAVDERPRTELKETLGTRVKDRLAPYEYPREIEFIDDLPKTSTGKVRRQSLREREGIADS
ncbi:acyl-CoA synthetase [Haloterrigena alkaliphila]|uniref:acyl-CoA synthetase n=1 Tax=Haloterrigena alkaliphila TaxID=2816475 RepID=UPI001CFFC4C8|nr:AMP-binding protein [Haloterrigena alkaliphila]UHQ95200.1 AMP-binding protein [Haloterrigena alkaliphila]